jgi:hypothetical protein
MLKISETIFNSVEKFDTFGKWSKSTSSVRNFDNYKAVFPGVIVVAKADEVSLIDIILKKKGIRPFGIHITGKIRL